jgi:hypothetical protein
MRGIGYGATRIVTAPVTWMAAAIVAAGGAYSYAMFGKKGLNNYVDFMDDVLTLDLDDLGDKLKFTGETIVEEAPGVFEDIITVGTHITKELARDFNELVIRDIERFMSFWTAPLRTNID